MNLTRSQLSLLITIFSMAIVVLALYNTHLNSTEKEEYVIELAVLDEEELEELVKEQEELQEELTQSESIKSHMAFNETAKASYGNPEPLKTLEELMAESESSSDSDEPSELLSSDNGYAANLKELQKKRKEAKELLGEREAQKDVPTNNLAKRRTSISYSLIDRNHITLPVPIYTCIEGGRIVINILVDGNGNVLEAEFNKKSSSTENGCLIDNAIKYALKSQFNTSSKAPQKGTITYLFQEKAR
ncbi:hypothetical protein [Cellulophaga sp. Hel_I_12]|uniref:hypothetical protein n=1 Tax=Cellulophaga sp. Hel_I_12 TaxID=1249972 RepID=UPI000645B012|nr:hypothetical protein [Cellulophaga sp. Hel_I_12]